MSTIKIKRDFGELDTITYSFRYVQLTENQKNEIEKEFSGANIQVETTLTKNNSYVVLLDLDKSIDSQAIKKLNDRLNIEETKFGVWVSLTTCYDMSGLSFPDYVVNFIRIVGGQVDVSTIMIS